MLSLQAVLSIPIGTFDALIVAIYLLATTLFGVWLGRGQVNNRDYFLAGHQLPTWALLLSIVATETSTVTFLSVPGKSFVGGGNFTFLQLAFGYIVGRLAIVVWLLPGYFRGEMMSAYEVLGRRFGPATRRTASFVFLVTRNLADGLRLFLTALALNIALGLNPVICIVVISIITAIYSIAGGVRSVVWNDCIQFAVYMLGAAATIWALVALVPGGWSQIAEFGSSTGRWKLFDFDPSLTKASVTFWSGFIGGAFLTLATHGADQMIVQRFLCARNQTSAGWALALSGFVVLAQFAVFLLIGVGLACFYSVSDTTRAPGTGDTALMTFVVNHMGTGLKGLILAAVLAATMCNLSGSYNSSASSLMSDWLGDLVAKMSDRKSLQIARLLTLLSAVVHALVAYVAYELTVKQAIVDTVLAIAGFSTGLVLGLYALGLCAPKTPERVALSAFVVGTIVVCSVMYWTSLSGFWYTLVGSTTIVAVGALLNTIFVRPSEAPATL